MTTTITLPADFVVDHARQIAEAWMPLVEQCKDGIVVDAASAEHADSAGIQLLLALAKETAFRNLSLVIRAPSSRLMLMMRAMGVYDRFTISE